MPLRYAFDLGTNYLSWCVYELDNPLDVDVSNRASAPVGLRDMGVHTFANGRHPHTRAPLGALRRDVRGRRRLQNRTVQRRTYVLSLLDEHGLLPVDKTDRDAIMQSDPYTIRSNALTQKVSLHQLGRALFHLNKHRGFKSSRQSETTDITGKIAAGNQRLRALLKHHECKTIGQYLALRQASENPQHRLTTRTKLQGQGASAHYAFYPTRDMVESEFNLIWAQQTTHHACLTESLKATFMDAIFYQRAHKPAEPGRCLFYPNEKRLANNTMLAHSIHLFQQLSDIVLLDNHTQRLLTLDERDALYDALMSGQHLSWKQVRARLDIPAHVAINLEIDGKKKLRGNTLAIAMIGTSNKAPGPLRDRWHSMSTDEKDTVLDRLRTSATDNDVIAWAKKHYQLDQAQAVQLAHIALATGYLNIGPTAAALIAKQLQEHASSYADALTLAGLSRIDNTAASTLDRLPAYHRVPSLQRYLSTGTGNDDNPADSQHGRIANPSVHIALNQLRRTVNGLIDRYGKPADIIIELAQELKQTEKQRTVYQRRINARRGADEARKKHWLKSGMSASEQKKIPERLLKLRLWEELGEEPRRCLYSGQTITREMLYTDQVAIDHILPLSQTLDDSLSNKTITIKKVRQLKRQLTPAEAALAHPSVFDLARIRERSRSLAKNKRWRFDSDAMERFDHVGGFIARFHNDERYVNRVVKTYLDTLFPQSTATSDKRCVWVSSGQLTASLRKTWRLQSLQHTQLQKDDRRHHALNAAVIGVTDSTLLKQLSASAAQQQQSRRKHIALEVAEPYPNFRHQVLHHVSTLVVSSRANHSDQHRVSDEQTTGRLHQDMNYGLVSDIPENATDRKLGNVVRRVPVSDLTTSMITRIRDHQHRESLIEFVYMDRSSEDKALTRQALTEKLSQWSAQHGIQRIRVLWPIRSVKPINNSEGEPYRFVKPATNVFMDVYETNTGDWIQFTTDSFTTNTTGSEPADSSLTFIMRLQKHDYLQLLNSDTGENNIMKIYALDPLGKRIKLALPNEGGQLQRRNLATDDPFRWDYAPIVKLKDRRARRVRFTAAGRMKTIPYGSR